MNKKIINLIIFSFLMVSATAFAADAVNPPGVRNISVPSIMSNILTLVWQFFVGITVIMFIIAGVLFVTSSGDPGKISTARSAFIWGVVGIIVAVVAFSIVQIVSSWV